MLFLYIMDEKNFRHHITQYKIPINDISLFIQAVTHRSHLLNETDVTTRSYNESLEFLGDAILGFVVANYLFNKYPDKQEGILSKIKGYVVSRYSLFNIAISLGLADIIRVKGITVYNVDFAAPLADAVEAIFGAIYLDGGLEIVSEFILSYVVPLVDEVLSGSHHRDYKSMLQHYVQAHFNMKPVYHVEKTTGLDHEKTYYVTVSIPQEKKRYLLSYGPAVAPSKKLAEQRVAKIACETLSIVGIYETLF